MRDVSKGSKVNVIIVVVVVPKELKMCCTRGLMAEVEKVGEKVTFPFCPR